MADRTSAGIYGNFFNILAKNPTDENKAIAAELWEGKNEFDFSAYQMYADDALIVLGLARMGIDPDYPNDGETIIYNE